MGRRTVRKHSDVKHTREHFNYRIFVDERRMKKQPLSYTAYGELWARPDACLGYNGEWKDEILQSYSLGQGHRHYSPALMRFLSPDALSPFGQGGVNTYCYCLGDPVNRFDPSGRTSIIKLLMPWRRTGLTQFLKQHGIPKEPLKPFLKTWGKSLSVYKKQKDGTYNHFLIKEKGKNGTYDALPHPVLRDQLAGKIVYTKGDLRIDPWLDDGLERNYAPVDKYFKEYGFKRVTYPPKLLTNTAPAQPQQNEPVVNGLSESLVLALRRAP